MAAKIYTVCKHEEIIKKQKAGIYRRINIVLRWMPAFLSNVFC